MPAPSIPSVEQLTEGVLSGNRVLLSRAVTLIESSLPSHFQPALQLLSNLRKYAVTSRRIGITGAPGVGKSTFIEAFGQELVQRGGKLAVLAIDPSGIRRPGSILGDKTRMDLLSRMPEVYIRPSPSGTEAGGIARRTAETITLCEAAGYSTIIVETVGVGQNEVPVRNLTDLFMLLLMPGAGDELQGIKRGIMEMADIAVITKADGESLTKAKVARAQIENALHLMPPNSWPWVPPVLLSSAISRTGIAETADACERFFEAAQACGYLQQNRRNQQAAAFRALVREGVWQQFISRAGIPDQLFALEQAVAEGRTEARAAAEKVLGRTDGSSNE